MNLVIIEGIGKKDTIKKYLGSGYDVVATGGHFRDLPKSTLSVDVENNYEPRYILMKDKLKNIKTLKEKAAKAKHILLATDPDREGEAIAWHLGHILGVDADAEQRIVFNEITKSAVTKALESPRAIDMNLVNAQQARRVLDRLVGYKLSPVVCKKLKKSKLSAGRVQSVTLKLVVLREREILNFKPEEYWTFGAILEKDKLQFLASLIKGPDGKKLKLANKEEVEVVLAAIDKKDYIVKEVRKSISRAHAPAPYTTSSMQQDALNRAGLSLKRCGMAAQALYEGVNMGADGKTALVTYIRTDSVRVAPEAQYAAKDYIVSTFGENYAPEKFNFYKSKKSAQDAHEAIRPTNLNITPEKAEPYLESDQAKLYKLIYNRFLASQMSEATFNSVSVDIDCNNYEFRVTGRTPIFDGWQRVYNMDEVKKDAEDGNVVAKLPELTEKDLLKFIKLEYAQKFTKPPARYTEATLVKAMEEHGIGRPATYNPIIQNIAARYYTEKEGKSIKPTELGFVVVDLLEKYFDQIMNVEFTAGLEEKLDDIAYEGIEWVKVIDDFYKPFEKRIEVAMEGEDNFALPLEESDTPCPNCQKLMIIRIGRFGKFLACPGFPDCKSTMPFAKPVATCPKCQKGIYSRKSKKGKVFFGCQGYPDCDFVAWDEPTGELCKDCQSPITKKKTKEGEKVSCQNRECPNPPQPREKKEDSK